MTETEAQTVKIGDCVLFKLCDSPYVHGAEVIDIVIAPASSVYSPQRSIFVCRDNSTGWTHRLSASDLR